MVLAYLPFLKEGNSHVFVCVCIYSPFELSNKWTHFHKIFN